MISDKQHAKHVYPVLEMLNKSKQTNNPPPKKKKKKRKSLNLKNVCLKIW